MQTCPSGTFGDNDTRVCLDSCFFQSPKFTWEDRLNNFCVTLCPYGYFADNFTGGCELTCSNGTFSDPSSRRCVINCPNNPASFSTAEKTAMSRVWNRVAEDYAPFQVDVTTESPSAPTAPRGKPTMAPSMKNV